jgi:hypothetical protein
MTCRQVSRGWLDLVAFYNSSQFSSAVSLRDRRIDDEWMKSNPKVERVDFDENANGERCCFRPIDFISDENNDIVAINKYTIFENGSSLKKCLFIFIFTTLKASYHFIIK